MDNVTGLAQSLLQLFPTINRVVDSLRFLIEQPMIREPYQLGTSAPGGAVIPAGAMNVVQLQSDFSHSLEWPFQVSRIRFSNDAAHTFRDWRVRVLDQTFNHEWMKNPIMVDALIDANTGFWDLQYPWIIRPQGGGQQWYVDNLDTANPITINITLEGHLLIPNRGK